MNYLMYYVIIEIKRNFIRMPFSYKFIIISRSQYLRRDISGDANVQSTGGNVDTVQVLDDIASLLTELRETLLSHNMKGSRVCDKDKCT